MYSLTEKITFYSNSLLYNPTGYFDKFKELERNLFRVSFTKFLYVRHSYMDQHVDYDNVKSLLGRVIFLFKGCYCGTPLCFDNGMGGLSHSSDM